MLKINWSEAVKVKPTGFVIGIFINPGETTEIDLGDDFYGAARTAGENGGYRIRHPAGDQNFIEASRFQELFEPAKPTGKYNVPNTATLFRSKASDETVWEMVSLPEGGAFNEDGKQIVVERGGGVIRSGTEIRAINAGERVNGFTPL